MLIQRLTPRHQLSRTPDIPRTFTRLAVESTMRIGLMALPTTVPWPVQSFLRNASKYDGEAYSRRVWSLALYQCCSRSTESPVVEAKVGLMNIFPFLGSVACARPQVRKGCRGWRVHHGEWRKCPRPTGLLRPCCAFETCCGLRRSWLLGPETRSVGTLAFPVHRFTGSRGRWMPGRAWKHVLPSQHDGSGTFSFPWAGRRRCYNELTRETG